MGRAARFALVLACLSVFSSGSAFAFDEAAALREGFGHLNARRWVDAEAPFRRVVTNNPHHQQALLSLALIWLQLGKPVDALDAVNRVLKQDGKNARALYRRGQVLFAMLDYAGSEPDFRRVLKLAPGLEPARTRLQLGLSLTGRRKYGEAITWLEAAWQENPKVIGANLYYYRNLAISLMLRGNYRKAQAVFGKGLKRFPTDLVLLHNAGRTQGALGIRNALRTYFDRAATAAYTRLTLTPPPLFDLPFRGRWVVAKGHDSLPTHVGLQTYALDFVRVGKKGRSAGGKGKTNGDFIGFGADILAPEVGTIVAIEDGTPDNPVVGKHADALGPGNYVTIQHADGVRSEMLHLRNGSVVVKPGQVVQKGEKIGEGGNSGYSLGPHLHISFSRKLDDAWVSVPVEFRNFTLRRNQSDDTVVKGAPAKGDTVEPTS